MFNDDWALATSGTIDDYNTCTIGWGSLGDVWGPPSKGRSIVTIYINPNRYTDEYIMKNAYFTVNFFKPEYKKNLAYLGSHGGRDIDIPDVSEKLYTRLPPHYEYIGEIVEVIQK